MNFGVLNLAKARRTKHFHAGAAVLIAASFCAFLGVQQSSARSITPVPMSGVVKVKALRAVSPLNIDVAAVSKLKSSIKTELAMVKARAADIKKTKAAFDRARLRQISHNYARPTSNYHLTAGFGDRSWLWGHRHTGQDFAAPYGTSVRAAESGTVVFAGWSGSYGRKIAISHQGNIQTWYGHLSSINVRVGQHIKVGQLIGRVGSSGHVTGTHLHFEVQRYGVPIDPVKWLRAVGIWV